MNVAHEGSEATPKCRVRRGCEGEARHEGKAAGRRIPDRILDGQHESDRRVADGGAGAFAAEKARQHFLLEARVDRPEIAKHPTLFKRLEFRDCEGELRGCGTNQRNLHASTSCVGWACLQSRVRGRWSSDGGS